MQEYKFEAGAINVDALNEQLSGFRPTYGGFVYDGKALRVQIAETATKEEIAGISDVVRRHDPAVLTDAQQGEAAQVAQLDKLNKVLAGAPLDEKLYGGNELMLALVRRITWLELRLSQIDGINSVRALDSAAVGQSSAQIKSR